jgi:hypothetical protein
MPFIKEAGIAVAQSQPAGQTESVLGTLNRALGKVSV